MYVRLAILASALVLGGCKPSVQISTGAFIIGSNDIQKYDGHQKSGGDIDAVIERVRGSTVLLATEVEDGKRKFCSGTLIAESSDEPGLLRVITSFHCFANIDDKNNVSASMIPEACKSTTVYLNFIAENPDKAVAVACKQGSLKTDYDGDLAVFTLNKPLGDQFRPVSIWDQPSIPDNRRAFIIHYPDIADNYVDFGSPTIHLPIAAITKDNCTVKGDFPIQEWHLDHTLPFSVQHTCDLLHGSSGSGLIDAETGALLGVNWGGIKVNYAANTRTTNVAIKPDFITAFLAGDLKTLKEVRQAASADATSKANADATKDPGDGHKSMGAQAKKAVCGVVEGSTSRPNFMLLLALLLAPLGICRPKRSRAA